VDDGAGAGAILGALSVDVAVATPTFLDLTFVGLEALPELNTEKFAAELLSSPGGGAITAIGTHRLGLSTALVAPLGEDGAGEFVRETLEGEGIAVMGRICPRTPTTVVPPIAGDRAMVTVDPGVRAAAADVAATEPRAVAVSLDQLHVVPSGAAAYVTCGDDDVRAFRGRPPAALAGARGLFVSEREAMLLAGTATAEDAARELAQLAEAVIVTIGDAGAIVAYDGRTAHVEGYAMPTTVDTTGAGDLLVSAYIWAEHHGIQGDDRFRWAVLYAGLSVTRPTGAGGASDEAELLAAGAERGLAPPGRADAVSTS
jgi:sugar/nucleoside kinase (ribokinase family)